MLISPRYHYLLQADADLISLDDYVLNTGEAPIRHSFLLHCHTDSFVAEAHPLLSNPNRSPGASNLWTPPSPSSPHADLGTRAEGTPAQKWTRYAHLEPFKGAVQGKQPGGPKGHISGGGKGMGGGGGRPGEIPKLPAEYYLRPDAL